MDHSAESFSQHLNTIFKVKLESGESIELELVEVTVREIGPTEQAGMERFSVFFYGPVDFYLPQQTYELVHPEMGEMYLFIVPIGQHQKGIKYEAVFNLFKGD
jgi:hypothetical protein